MFIENFLLINEVPQSSCTFFSPPPSSSEQAPIRAHTNVCVISLPNRDVENYMHRTQDVNGANVT
jgi:hypothetical protein